MLPLSARAPQVGGLKRAEARFGIALEALPLAAFTAVILYPFVDALRPSLYRYTLMSPQPVFDGLRNFERLAEDGEIGPIWVNTVVFVEFRSHRVPKPMGMHAAGDASQSTERGHQASHVPSRQRPTALISR